MTEKFMPGEWKAVIGAIKKGISEAQKEANMHLIAAAPDLYNALKDLVGNSRSGWQEVNVSKETIENALKALSKASGGKE